MDSQSSAQRRGPNISQASVALLAALGVALHGLDAWLAATGSAGAWRIAGGLGWLAWAGAARVGLGEIGRAGSTTAIGPPDPAGPRVSRIGGWVAALAIVGLGEALRHGPFATAPADIEAPVVATLKDAPTAAVLAFALAPALGEELFFRGSLLRGLARRHGPVLAGALSAGSFAVVHPHQVLAAATFGAALAGLALATGRSREAVAAHALHNLLGLRILGL